MKLYLDIRNFTKAKINKSELGKVASKTLSLLGVKGTVGISLAMVGAKRIKSLNKKYRRVANTTDVLAFGASPAKKDRFIEPPDKVRRLGEIIICLDAAKTQAKFFSHPLKEELAILLVHGILHLLGWRDETPKEKKEMREMEEKVLKGLVKISKL